MVALINLDPAPSGDQGIQGSQGIQGAQGPSGVVGPPGIQGPIGPPSSFNSAFRVFPSGSTAIASGIWNELNWDIIKFDLGNEFVLASGGFIPRSSGAYNLHTRATVADIDNGGEILARIRKNYTTTVALSENMRNDSGGTLPLQVEIAGSCTAVSGDIFTVEVRHNQLTTKQAVASGAFFDGWKLEIGQKGETGDTGPIGPSGAQGITGPSGVQGLSGIQGVQGDTGSQGSIGPSGLPGPSGEQGLQGAQGNTGSQGLIGPSGLQGLTGPSGAQGLTGPSGTQGEQGTQGVEGPEGPNSAFRVDPSGITTDIGVITGAVLETNLVSYWKLQESGGQDRLDTLGNNDLLVYAGGAQGGSIPRAVGILGSGADLDIDNKNLRVTRPTFDRLDSDTFSLSFWFKSQTPAATTFVCAVTAGSVNGWNLAATIFDSLQFQGFKSGIEWDIVTSNNVFQSGVFHNIILTRTNNNAARIYVDGVLEAEDLTSGTTDFVNDLGSTDDFVLGTRGSAANPTDAIYDETAFWNRELAQEEVTRIYNSGSGNFFDNNLSNQFDLSASAAGIWNQLNWSEIVFDLGSEFVLASGGFIPQNSGVYNFHTRVTVDDISDGGEIRARIRKNYSETIAISEAMRNDSGGILPVQTEIAGTTLVASGDIFTIEVKHNQSQIKQAGASGTFFDGWRLAQGEVGPSGAQGTQGIQGIVGPSGIQGLTGPSGAQGIQGVQGIVGSSGSQADPATYFQAYVTDNIIITTDFEDLPLDVERVKDSAFIHDPSGAEVTVLADGTYTTFSFICTDLLTTGQTPPVAISRIMRSVGSGDFAEIPGTRGTITHDDVNNKGSCITTPVILPLASGDRVKIQTKKEGGPDKVAVASGASLTLINIGGARGEPGPSGFGPIGLQGVQGIVGPSGVAGPSGSTGSQGIIGPSGSQGTTGIQGVQGIQGPVGPNSAFRVDPSGISTTIGASGTIFLKNGLVSYWKLEEAAGNDRLDSVSSNDLFEATASNPGGPVQRGVGVLGSGADLDIDNKNLRVDQPTFDRLDSDTFSLSFWFKSQTPAATTFVCALTSASTNGWNLAATIFDSLQFQGFKSGAQWDITTSNNIFQSGVFHNIVLTRTNNNAARIYVDGVLEAEDLTSGTTDFVNDLTSSDDFVLGTRGSAANPTDAIYDETAFWNRELTQAEVTQLYNSGSGNFYDNNLTNQFDLFESSQGIWTQLNWNRTKFNLGNEFVLASGGFIPQGSGAYNFHTIINIDDIASNGQIRARIRKNHNETVAISETMRNDSGGTLPLQVEIAGTCTVASGDIFTIEAKHDQITTKEAGASGTFFDGWKLAGADRGLTGPSGSQGTQGIPGVPDAAKYFQAYVTDVVEVTTQFQDIPFDVERIKSSTFSHDPGGEEITVLASGTYTVLSFICTEMITTGQTVPITETRMMLNTGGGYVEIPGTRGALTHDDPSNIGGCATTPVVLSLASGNSIKLQARKTNEPDTVVISSGTSITVIDIGGARGNTGPQGSPNPDVLTFIGAISGQALPAYTSTIIVPQSTNLASGISTLDINIGQSHINQIDTITTNLTATINNTIILVNAINTALQVTLPNASGNEGKIYHIKKIDSTNNNVTVSGLFPNTIDGSLTQTIFAQYDSMMIVSDDTNWHIV